MLNPLLQNFIGLRVLQSDAMTEPCINLAGCRSPSRALRRWQKRGIKGRIGFVRPSTKVLQIDRNTLVCHPAMYRQLVTVIAAAKGHDHAE